VACRAGAGDACRCHTAERAAGRARCASRKADTLLCARRSALRTAAHARRVRHTHTRTDETAERVQTNTPRCIRSVVVRFRALITRRVTPHSSVRVSFRVCIYPFVHAPRASSGRLPSQRSCAPSGAYSTTRWSSPPVASAPPLGCTASVLTLHCANTAHCQNACARKHACDAMQLACARDVRACVRRAGCGSDGQPQDAWRAQGAVPQPHAGPTGCGDDGRSGCG
jgi:hypothetical protein